MLDVGRFTSARTRAVEAFADLDLGQRDEEHRSTQGTATFDGPRSSTVGERHRQFARRQDCPLAGLSSMGVASVATRSEVLGAVVAGVMVQVIHHDRCPVGCSRSGHPFKRDATPVAWMRARADGVVEGDSRGGEHASFRGNRVAWGSDEPVRDAGAFGARVCVVARGRAEAVGAVLPSVRYRRSAVLAGVVCHNPQYSNRRY